MEKHTIEEWGKITGIVILDADGFDRQDPKLMERLFTEEEFNKGIISSTIKFLKIKETESELTLKLRLARWIGQEQVYLDAINNYAEKINPEKRLDVPNASINGII